MDCQSFPLPRQLISLMPIVMGVAKRMRSVQNIVGEATVGFGANEKMVENRRSKVEIQGFFLQTRKLDIHDDTNLDGLLGGNP